MKQALSIFAIQTNSSVNGWSENAERINHWVQIIRHKRRATSLEKNSRPVLYLFPEGQLSGYPWHDLMEQKQLLTEAPAWIEKLKNILLPNEYLLLGTLWPNESNGPLTAWNTALFMTASDHKLIKKSRLPNQDVFFESRWIEPGSFDDNLITIAGWRIFVTICEDIWGWDQPYNTLNQVHADCDLVINLSASPFEGMQKWQRRKFMVQQTARHFSAPMIYVNRVGGEDELIFDGLSFACDPQGNGLAEAPFGEESALSFKLHTDLSSAHSVILSYLDTLTTAPTNSSFLSARTTQSIYMQNRNGQLTQIQNLFSNTIPGTTPNRNEKPFDPLVTKTALLIGLRDFVRKNGFKRVHLGLSGGIDSAVVLCLAVEALGAEHVTAIMLPSRFNAAESLSWAKALCTQVNCEHKVISIESLYAAFEKTWAELGFTEFNVTHENAQARLRGLLLMAYSNEVGSLLLGCSNKSELLVGYSTLYGDMVGGLLPIGDLWKSEVYAIADWYYRNYNWIPYEIIERAPSAELRPGQKDQDTLPTYEILEMIGHELIQPQMTTQNDLSANHSNTSKTANHARALIHSLWSKSEFKRWQSPPILKVSPRAFGHGRWYPVTKK